MENEKKQLTLGDIIKSEHLEQAVHHVLDPISVNIEKAQKSCKQGERLRSTPILRLYKQGILRPDNFVLESVKLFNKESSLSSDLRATLRELFGEVATEVAKAEQAVTPKEEKGIKE